MDEQFFTRGLDCAAAISMDFSACAGGHDLDAGATWLVGALARHRLLVAADIEYTNQSGSG